jgi:periplasmic copper chaperone A
MKTTLAALTAAAALALPATAGAHVTLQPRQAAAGSFSKLDVRVPNERDNKGTVKVELRLPDGFYFLSYKKVPGWKVKLTRERLDTPVDLGGFSVSERFTRIVWKGNPRKGGIIRPEQFEEFPISVRMPSGNPGDELVFPAFQTYRGGERVAWTGGPDADEPAPRVTLTAPDEE